MNIRFVILGIVIALGVATAATYVPLSTQHERIVALKDVSESIPLQLHHHIRQTIRPAEGTYAGAVLFSDEDTLDDRTLVVSIEDLQGKRIARSYAVRSSYRSSGDVLEMQALMPWFSVQDGQEYVLDIFLKRGPEMSLKTVRHESTQEQLISLSLLRTTSAAFGFRQGVYVGSAFLLCIVLLTGVRDQRRKLLLAIVLVILFAPLATLGYWFSDNDLGISDWDYYFTLHDSYRRAIVEHHTFPLWNPYICGGTAGLGDPEFPVFSPTFLLELIFGIPVGVRLAIVLSTMVGSIGMLMLSRRLGRSTEAGLIAALAVAFGTVNLLEITEGHVNVLAAMWIPWILWSWHRMVFANKYPMVCGIFLALTFLGGGIYLLMYTALAFIGLILFVDNRRAALTRTLYAALWAMGFAAFKLIPVLFWLRQFPDDAYASSSYTLPWIVDILFGRHLHGSEIIPRQMSGWHEYGAYIGYIVFGLALIGLSYWKQSRTVRLLLLAAVIATGLSILGPQLRPLFDQLWFFPRSSISRFILFAVIPLCLLASYGGDRIARIFPRRGKYIRAILIGCVAIDLFSLTYQLSEQAFVLPHTVDVITPAAYPLEYTVHRYDTQGNDSRSTRSYDAYLKGYGTLTYCSVLGPKPSVRTIMDEDHRFVYVSGQDAHAEVLSWGYNKIRVRGQSSKDAVVVLNANYADGWKANRQKAIIVDNKVATSVPAGTYDITFRYTPPGLFLGQCISIGALLFASFRKRIRSFRNKIGT